MRIRSSVLGGTTWQWSIYSILAEIHPTCRLHQLPINTTKPTGPCFKCYPQVFIFPSHLMISNFLFFFIFIVIWLWKQKDIFRQVLLSSIEPQERRKGELCIMAMYRGSCSPCIIQLMHQLPLSFILKSVHILAPKGQSFGYPHVMWVQTIL